MHLALPRRLSRSLLRLFHVQPGGNSVLNWWISPSCGHILSGAAVCSLSDYRKRRSGSVRAPIGTVLSMNALKTTPHTGRWFWVQLLLLWLQLKFSWNKAWQLSQCFFFFFWCEIICPPLPRVKDATGWLYLECHFVFGWLDSTLSWIGFSDEGTGEARRGAALSLSTVFPLLKQPYILICNICAGRAFQNGCSLEDDGRVCSNLGLGHLVLRGSAQMLAFTMSFCPLLQYPGRSILREAGVFSSLAPWDHFICTCQCNSSRLVQLNWDCCLWSAMYEGAFSPFIYHLVWSLLHGISTKVGFIHNIETQVCYISQYNTSSYHVQSFEDKGW